MRLRVGVVGIALILVFPGSARLESNSDTIVSACAAFGPDGSSATATSDNSDVRLQVDDRSGSVLLNLATPLRYPLRSDSAQTQVARRYSSCAVYYSRDGQYVAFGFQSRFFQPQAAYLQIVVANLQSRTWIGNWGVEPPADSSSSISLAGFLEGVDSLVVTAKPYDQRVGGGENGTIATQLFSPSGHQVGPLVSFQNPSETTDAFRHFADAAHNRLWSFSCAFPKAKKPYELPLCPVSVTDLVAERRENTSLDFSEYKGKRDELWWQPPAFAAISADTIMIAETVDGVDTIWRVDMPTQAIDRFALPHHHWVKYNGLGPSSLSPDTEVYGVLLQQLELGFPYIMDNYVFRGTDVIVMQTNPLRLLGTLPHKDASFTAGLAVDHRDGKARVLVYRQNQWEHHEFADMSSERNAGTKK